MSWNILVAENAKKQLKRIPEKDALRVHTIIGDMEENPFRGDIAKLDDGDGRWRRRVGNYRILYRVLLKKRVIFIYDIRRRTGSTY